VCSSRRLSRHRGAAQLARPFDSIAALVEAFGGQAMIGAGTVRRTEDLARLGAAGGVLA